MSDKPEDIAERGRKGFCTRDTYGFDTYLAKVIAGGVKELREREHGVPGDREQEEWYQTLDKIILGFEQYAVNSDGGMFFGYDQQPEFLEAMRLLSENFSALWD